MKKQILVVDDEPEIRSLLKDILEEEGFIVELAENAAIANQKRQSQRADLTLLDVWLPDHDGLKLLEEWTFGNDYGGPVVVMTGHGTLETAVEAIKLGAYDFIEKPLSTPKLLISIKRALESERLIYENKRLREMQLIEAKGIKQGILQKSKSLDYEKLALVNTHILIIGEGGTGKETLARYIHSLSKKRSETFISSNLAALNSEEQDRELFGSEENHLIRYGLLEVAKGGALFLKELASLNPGGQAKLVKALEDGVFFRCGGSEPLVFNTRIIASSRNPLEPLLENGKFRDDLYYLLNVAPILLPPLRARIDELESFINFFSDQLGEIENLKPRHFSKSAMDRLKQHEWPGNIRELKNLIHRLFITGISPTIEDEELNPILSKQSEIASALDSSLFTLPLKKARLEFEKIYLEKQLKIFENNVSKVSEFIGVERTHLYRKLRNLNVSTKTQRKLEDI